MQFILNVCYVLLFCVVCVGLCVCFYTGQYFCFEHFFNLYRLYTLSLVRAPSRWKHERCCKLHTLGVMTVNTQQGSALSFCLCSLHVELYLLSQALSEPRCLFNAFFIDMFNQIILLVDTYVVWQLNIRLIPLLTMWSVNEAHVA